MVTAQSCTHRLVLDTRHRCLLERIVRQTHCPQAIALRARVILAASEGWRPTEIGRRLDCSRELARRWRDRFADAQARWASDAPEWDQATLTDKILEVLEDRLRSGAPPRFTAEQLCQIVALACEQRPQDCDRPVSHWTARELADEAVLRGIVPSISPRHVGRFLKKRTCGRIACVTG